MISETLAPLLGFLGVLVGVQVSIIRDRTMRRHAFVEKQLRDLYSPLLSIRSEIKAKSELRVEISRATGAAWHQLCANARETSNPPDSLYKLEQTRLAEFEAVIKYNNQQLVGDLMPAYKKMVQILRDNLWLSEPETRDYFAQLTRFVDLWDRWLSQSIPAEAIEQLPTDERILHPFYQHLESQHKLLRQRLSKGNA